MHHSLETVDENVGRRWEPEECGRRENFFDEKDGLESMQSGSQPVLPKKSLVRELRTTIPNEVPHALSQS